eukprot:4796986-Pleurochrysis_carterae.AAC.1
MQACARANRSIEEGRRANPRASPRVRAASGPEASTPSAGAARVCKAARRTDSICPNGRKSSISPSYETANGRLPR